jgi:hypothetical protein
MISGEYSISPGQKNLLLLGSMFGGITYAILLLLVVTVVAIAKEEIENALENQEDYFGASL